MRDNWLSNRVFTSYDDILDGRVPPSGVAAVGKWPDAATAKGLAATGHLSTAVVIDSSPVGSGC